MSFTKTVGIHCSEMKGIIVLVAFAVVATTAKRSILVDDARTRINKLEKRCKGASHVGEYSIEETICGVLVDDDKEINYLRCIFTEMNWIKWDSFNADGFKKDINKDSPSNVINSCNNLQSTGSQLIVSICHCISITSNDNPDY